VRFPPSPFLATLGGEGKKFKTENPHATHRISHLAQATYASTVGRALTYRS